MKKILASAALSVAMLSAHGALAVPASSFTGNVGLIASFDFSAAIGSLPLTVDTESVLTSDVVDANVTYKLFSNGTGTVISVTSANGQLKNTAATAIPVGNFTNAIDYDKLIFAAATAAGADVEVTDTTGVTAVSVGLANQAAGVFKVDFASTTQNLIAGDYTDTFTVTVTPAI